MNVARYPHFMVPNPFYVELGTVIKTKRKALRMKQKTLAAQIGISRGSLANIETGRQSLLVHQLYKFAEALSLQPQDLLPVVTERPRSTELNGLMPDTLKPTQKDQLARLIEDAPVAAKGEKEGDNAKSTNKPAKK